MRMILSLKSLLIFIGGLTLLNSCADLGGSSKQIKKYQLEDHCEEGKFKFPNSINNRSIIQIQKGEKTIDLLKNCGVDQGVINRYDILKDYEDVPKEIVANFIDNNLITQEEVNYIENPLDYLTKENLEIQNKEDHDCKRYFNSKNVKGQRPLLSINRIKKNKRTNYFCNDSNEEYNPILNKEKINNLITGFSRENGAMKIHKDLVSNIIRIYVDSMLSSLDNFTYYTNSDKLCSIGFDQELLQKKSIEFCIELHKIISKNKKQGLKYFSYNKMLICLERTILFKIENQLPQNKAIKYYEKIHKFLLQNLCLPKYFRYKKSLDNVESIVLSRLGSMHYNTYLNLYNDKIFETLNVVVIPLCSLILVIFIRLSQESDEVSFLNDIMHYMYFYIISKFLRYFS